MPKFPRDCKRCFISKQEDKFTKGRLICKKCRNVQTREARYKKRSTDNSIKYHTQTPISPHVPTYREDFEFENAVKILASLKTYA